MILGEFKRKNIKRRIARDLKKPVKRNTNSGAKIKSVLLLVNHTFNDNVSKRIIDELGLVESRVKVITFQIKSSKEKTIENNFSEKDFGLFGNFKNVDVKKILNAKFDLLVNYVTENQYVESLSVTSNAMFKVGFLNNNTLIYDLMIDVDKNDFESFNKELIKYLKILNKI